MPIIDLPVDGEVPYGVKLRAAINAVNTAVNTAQAKVDALESSWAAYTPTWTNLAIGNATVDARYKQMGKTVHLSLQMTLGSTTSVSGFFFFSLPTSITSGFVGSVWAFDSSATIWQTGIFAPGAYFIFGTSRASATAPFTWTTGDLIRVTLTYEAP